MILFYILIGIAALLALLDLVLVHNANSRRWWLLPVSVLLVCLALVLQGAGVLA